MNLRQPQKRAGISRKFRSEGPQQKACRKCGLGLAALALAIASFAHSRVSADSSLSGKVPLPEAGPAVVMSKHYEIVSRGGTLSTEPPIAVVWLESDVEVAPSNEIVEIAQRDFVFEPSILAIQVGTTVAFPNYDDEYHNVFSYSRPHRFDLGRYMPDERPVPTQTFDQPGQIVLRCDIHEHMKAVILVLDSRHFVKTDTAGDFQLTDIPKGEYILKAWIDTKTTLEQPVSVDGSSNLEVNF